MSMQACVCARVCVGAYLCLSATSHKVLDPGLAQGGQRLWCPAPMHAPVAAGSCRRLGLHCGGGRGGQARMPTCKPSHDPGVFVSQATQKMGQAVTAGDHLLHWRVN